MKEIMKDVQQNTQENISYLVRNDELDVLGLFNTLNYEIAFAEKRKENICDIMIVQKKYGLK